MEKTTNPLWFGLNAKWEALPASDDFIFSKMMRDPSICKGLIETLLEIKIDHIEYPEIQKSIDLTKASKGVRLDVYVNDDEGTIYNVEMQTTSQKELAKRARYYQGMIDLNTIEKGQLYHELRKSYVIFICTFDPFGKERSVYAFENICKDDASLKLNDETYKYFFNTKGKDIQNSLLKQTLNFFENILPNEPTDLIRKMSDAVQKIKTNDQWRAEYMTLMMREQEQYQNGLQAGIELGMAQGHQVGLECGIAQERREIVNAMIGENLPFSLIAKITGVTEEELSGMGKEL